ARHGEGGGLRGGGNKKLEAFVEKVLSAPGSEPLDQLLADYQKKTLESVTTQETVAKQLAQQAPQNTKETTQATEEVEGRELVLEEKQQEQAATTQFLPWVFLLIAGCALLIAIGFWAGRGIPSK
ncbi:MAG TPA: hypothetical protein DIT97_04690, partial [Gimesia maris]|nr:hypothetical protein [Gimesia maris]